MDAGGDAARTFWAGLAAGEPRLQHDPAASRHLFPPRPMEAPSGNLEWRPITRGGTLLAVTVVRTPPADFVLPPPYRVGLVRLDAGPRMFGVVEGEAAIGDRVELVAEAAEGAAPLRFRPAGDRAAT